MKNNKKNLIKKNLVRKNEDWEEINSLEEIRSLFNPFSPLILNSEMNKLLKPFEESSGISVSEDDKNVYVEADLPGISPEQIEMSYDRGILSIKADKKEETQDRKKKFYRKAHESFFYQVAVPGSFDEAKTPEATCKNGILKVAFTKGNKSHIRKTIPIKKS